MHFVTKGLIGLRDPFLQSLDASLQRPSDILLLSLHLVSLRISILSVLLQAVELQRGQSSRQYDSASVARDKRPCKKLKIRPVALKLLG